MTALPLHRLVLSLALVLALAAGRARAADVPAEAIERGLGWLARSQRDDGSIGDIDQRTATTALALLAFLSNGHTPDVGRHGLAVRRALDFLVAAVPPGGYVGSTDGSRMYGQGIVTLALLEAMGVEPDPARRARQRDAAERMVAVLLRAQAVAKTPEHAGGWRYEPDAIDSDLSLSGWCLLSLRAAKNAGIGVPVEAVQRARAYVLRSFHPRQQGFAYTTGIDATASMTGVAVLALHLLDGASLDETRAGERFLFENPVTLETRYPHYAAYYATQAAYQAGGSTWAAVWANTRRLLLPLQQDDGGWPAGSADEPGRVYTTSLAILSLSVPNQLLPTYQR